MLPNSEGKRIPEVTFRTRENGQWKDVSTRELFSGRTVVVFALPGAYTPTCSSTHLPRYNELFPTFKQHGIDEIVCVSVNDAFVMSEWQKDQNAPNIRFIPDGNGEFTSKMGLLVDKSDLGFGKRSWRYAMLVRDGVIEKMFIEPEKDGDPFEVSDADTMLAHVAPNAKAPEPVAIISRPGCPHCARAKQLLDDRGIVFEDISLGKDVTFSTVRAITGRGTVPQVFIGGRHIGGADDLERYFATQEKRAA
jgi:glutaredoxin-like protein